jgi:hypothetical protein
MGERGAAFMSDFHDIKLQPHAQLLRKELFHYELNAQTFVIELFERQDGLYYAIGTPTDDTRLFVFGSSVVTDRAIALRQAIHKIDREVLGLDIFQVGEDVADNSEPAQDPSTDDADDDA